MIFKNIFIFKWYLCYHLLEYNNKRGRQFGESKRISYVFFMVTLGEGSRLGEGPNANFSLSVSPLNFHKPNSFSSQPSVLSTLQEFTSRMSFCGRSYQGETNMPSPQFPCELLPFHVTIMMKCVLSFTCVGLRKNENPYRKN